jgi:RpiB/LacA/LacB family sugar-phosphate isomerase
MAGLGSRFLDAGYIMPKQLIMVDGTQMIDWSLKSIVKEECNLIFAVRRDHIRNFSIDNILKLRYGNDIKIVVIEELTEGTVATCLLAKEYIDNDTPLFVYTLDVFFEPFFDPKDMEGNDGFLLTFKSNNDGYSYAEINSEGFVTRTAEKEVISENAAVGVYGYKTGSMFVKYAEKMVEQNIRTKGEFYVCPLYNLMIEDGLKITTKCVDKLHVMGTPAELDFFTTHTLKRFGTKPVALCCDHSGYDLKEAAKEVLKSNGLDYIDFGTFVNKDCDYNDYVSQAVEFVTKGECDFAMAFCRTGQGVNISGNKRKGIRGALIFDEYTAEHAIRHNSANFFSVPSKYVDTDLLDKMVKIWKATTFDGGRHLTRIQKVESYEGL